MPLGSRVKERALGGTRGETDLEKSAIAKHAWSQHH